MANIKPFDLMLTAGALTALFLLLPADKEAKVLSNSIRAPISAPVSSDNPKTMHHQPVTLRMLRQA